MSIYNIEVPMTQRELEEMIMEDKSFSWVFNTSEDNSVAINVNIFKEEDED